MSFRNRMRKYEDNANTMIGAVRQGWKEGGESAERTIVKAERFKEKHIKPKAEKAESWWNAKLAGWEASGEKKEAVRKERHAVYHKEFEQERLRLAKKKARIDARKTAFGGMFQKHSPKGRMISVGQSRNWLSGLAGETPTIGKKDAKERKRPPSMEDFFI